MCIRDRFSYVICCLFVSTSVETHWPQATTFTRAPYPSTKGHWKFYYSTRIYLFLPSLLGFSFHLFFYGKKVSRTIAILNESSQKISKRGSDKWWNQKYCHQISLRQLWVLFMLADNPFFNLMYAVLFRGYETLILFFLVVLQYTLKFKYDDSENRHQWSLQKKSFSF